MARTITVTSGKGGVGKTNLSLNLAVHLASTGHRTCLFDADLGLANVNVLLNQFPEKNLADVISGDKRLSEIIIHDSSGLDIIPGSSGVEKMADLDPDQIGRLIYDFSQTNNYEFYIFDTSPGISRNVIPFCLAASELIMVITPEPTSLVDAYALLKVLTLNGFKGQVKLILNQCPDKAAAKATYNRFKGAAVKRLPVEISPVGLILHDRHVAEAVKQQTPVVRLFPQAPASKSIRAMGKRIVEGGAEDIEDREIVLFWTRFFDSVRGPYNLGETTDTGRYLAASPPAADAVEKPVIVDDEPPTAIFKLSDIGLGRLMDPIPSNTENNEYDGIVLPSLPQTLVKLLKVLNYEHPQDDDIFQAISLDPALAFRVLKMGAPDRMVGKFAVSGGLKSAVKTLGPSTINNLVLTESVNRVYSSSFGVYQWDLSGFWRHSLRCAFLAGFLGEAFRGVDRHQAFLAGLLHDIGLLVQAEESPEFASVIEGWDNQDEDAFEASRESFSDHAGAGADLLGRSQIQPLIADAARYHHESPDRIREAFPLVRVVYCAEIMSRKQGRTSESLEKISEISGLGFQDLGRIIQSAEAKVNQTIAGIVAEGAGASGSFTQNGSALTQQVKTLSQLQGCTRQFLEARDRGGVVRTIHRSMEILFDLKNIVCLVFDPRDNALKGQFVEGMTPPVVEDIVITLERRNSLAIQALETGEITATFLVEDSDLCLIDRQLQSLLGIETLIFMPIPSESGHIGVVCAGGEREHLDPLFGQASQILLNMASLALSARAASEPPLFKENIDDHVDQPVRVF